MERMNNPFRAIESFLSRRLFGVGLFFNRISVMFIDAAVWFVKYHEQPEMIEIDPMDGIKHAVWVLHGIEKDDEHYWKMFITNMQEHRNEH